MCTIQLLLQAVSVLHNLHITVQWYLSSSIYRCKIYYFWSMLCIHLQMNHFYLEREHESVEPYVILKVRLLEYIFYGIRHLKKIAYNLSTFISFKHTCTSEMSLWSDNALEEKPQLLCVHIEWLSSMYDLDIDFEAMT